VKKNRLNRLEFWKNRPVWFWFYKLETEKTEPNPNKKNKKNRAKPVWSGFVMKNRTEPKPVGLNRFRFFKKYIFFGIVFFFNKNRTELKIITPTNQVLYYRWVGSWNIEFTSNKWIWIYKIKIRFIIILTIKLKPR
jgi:hypothetical protein